MLTFAWKGGGRWRCTLFFSAVCSLVITAAVITSPRWAFWLHAAIYSPIHRKAGTQKNSSTGHCQHFTFKRAAPADFFGDLQDIQCVSRPMKKLFPSTSTGEGGGKARVFLYHILQQKSAAPGLDVWVRQCLIDSTASEMNYFPCKTETKQNNHFLSCMVLSIPYIKRMQASVWYLIYSCTPVGPLDPKSTILHFKFLTAV